jgi:hypothetical protein
VWLGVTSVRPRAKELGGSGLGKQPGSAGASSTIGVLGAAYATMWHLCQASCNHDVPIDDPRTGDVLITRGIRAQQPDTRKGW